MTTKPPYELFNGSIDSPVKYVDFCIYQGRQQGKTYKLLMSIPNEPIVIVVHSQRYGRDLLYKLKELRPDYEVKNIKFVSWDRSKQYEDRLRTGIDGLKRPIYFDNCVLDMIQLEYVERINSLYGKR